MRLLKPLMVVLGVVLMAFPTYAQVITQYNGTDVVENSILVVREDVASKGISAADQLQKAELIRRNFNIPISKQYDEQGLEEWQVPLEDYSSVLAQLNAIPGVKAFPNYVFKREQLEATPISNELNDYITASEEPSFSALETMYGPEMIVNGDFSTGDLSGWEVFLADWIGVNADFAVTDGELSVTNIVGVDSTSWHVQLIQTLDDSKIGELVVGGMYELTFTASTDAEAKELKVYFGQNYGDFLGIVDTFITLGDTSTDYTIRFLMSDVFYSPDGTTPGMKLSIEPGTSTDALFLDNVSLRQVNSPVTSAPMPTVNVDSAISIFSDYFTNVEVDTYRTDWSQSLFEIDDLDGDFIIIYDSLNFVGIETVENQIDASEMTHIYFNVWTPNADVMRIKLVDFGADGVYSPAADGGDDSEHEIEFSNFPKNTWLTVNLPLYRFENMSSTSNIAQIIFSAAPAGESTLSIDNLFFYDNGLPTNDPFLYLQYALHNDGTFDPGYSVEGADISAFDAWNTTTGSDSVIVVVYDDGVDFTHPDLANQAWVNPGEDLNGDGIISEDEWNGIDDDGNGFVDDFWGWSSVYDDNSFINPGSFHGTHVAGIIGAEADNAMGISGVAQEVSMISVMIFDEYGYTNSLAIILGYHYISMLLEQGVEITAINQSWGGGRIFNDPSSERFIEVMSMYAHHHDFYEALWVVSAGNSTLNRDELPYYSIPNNIASSNIITVASSDDADLLSGFSDYGNFTVDIAAPGSNIASTYPGNSYVYLSGTSMASPQVTGAIALAKAAYPNESGHALMTRVLASGDYVSSFDAVGEGERLNAYAMLESSMGSSVSHDDVALFQRTYVDGPAEQTIGFINTTGSAVTVESVSFSGTEGTFATKYAFTPQVVAPGEAYGLPVAFFNGMATDEIASVATLSLSGGSSVEISLVGREQVFPSIELFPDFEDLGAIPSGSVAETSFEIVNDGAGDLYFDLEQTLYVMNSDLTEMLKPMTSFKSGEGKPNSLTAGEREALNDEIMAKVQQDIVGAQRTNITLSMDNVGSTESALLWFDDLNSPDLVANDWITLAYGEGDGAGKTFELAEIFGVGDYSFFAGDFTNGYSNNTIAVAGSPVFDFTALEFDGSEYLPSYLFFDYAASLEVGYDFFYVNVLSNGQRVMTLDITDNGNLINDGFVYTAYLDLLSLAGLENVEFWFIMNTDELFVDGFGALFDNVGIEVTPKPYFFSETDGLVEAGSSEEITVSVNTSVTGDGFYALETVVYNNSPEAISFGSPYHVMMFEAATVNVQFTEPYVDLGVFDAATEAIDYTLEMKNGGIVTADYYAEQFLSRFDDGFAIDAPPMKQATPGTKEAANVNKLRSNRMEQLKTRDLSGLKMQHKAKLKAQDRLQPIRSEMAADPSLEVVYYEGFDSGTFPEAWLSQDYSLGLGHEWDVLNYGSMDFPYYALGVGNTGDYYILNNTVTEAYSPIFDLSTITEDKTVNLEFAYSFLLEPGYDVASMFAVVLDENLFISDVYYIGSTEDVFFNDGSFQYGMLNLDFLKGELVTFVSVVETDESVYSAWALIDDILIYTMDKLSYITPSMGTIDSGAVATADVHINTNHLMPGDYTSVTMLLYYNEDIMVDGFAMQETYFYLENDDPVVVDDTLMIVAGDRIDMGDMLYMALQNDYDKHGLYIEDMSDPVYGDYRWLGVEDEWPHYVAPLNYDGLDSIEYMVSDGMSYVTGTIHIMVMAKPGFMTGSNQQFVFLEDNTLELSTMTMAAGVGGMDKEMMVWGESMHDQVTIEHDPNNHGISFSAAEDFYGQTEAMLYAGHMDHVMDSMKVSIIITPVNDMPTASFEFNQGDNGSSEFNFTSTSNDARDPEGAIVAYAWDFGDGTTSSDAAPYHNYSEAGSYTVRLLVTDNGGGEAEFTQQVSVSSVVSIDDETKPMVFALKQNYPNPFNPSTSIQYSIAESSPVTLEVFNMLGQKVAQLVNTTQVAGNYSVQFDAAGLSSGVYLYQLRAGSYLETRKMMLIK
jgi:subtilisin family serine protease